MLDEPVVNLRSPSAGATTKAKPASAEAKPATAELLQPLPL